MEEVKMIKQFMSVVRCKEIRFCFTKYPCKSFIKAFEKASLKCNAAEASYSNGSVMEDGQIFNFILIKK